MVQILVVLIPNAFQLSEVFSPSKVSRSELSATRGF